MKKMTKILFELLLCLALASSLAITAFAQEVTCDHPEIIDDVCTSCLVEIIDEIDVVEPLKAPKIILPKSPVASLTKLDIEVDEIINIFPDSLDIVYEEGTVKVKDIGVDAIVFNCTNENLSYEMTLVDGFWILELPEEKFNLSYVLDLKLINSNGDEWTISYDDNGIIYMLFDMKSAGVSLKIVSSISYVVYDDKGIKYSDKYEDGIFVEQNLRLVLDQNVSFVITYDSSGTLIGLSAYDLELDTYFYYHDNMGWSTEENEFVQAEIPQFLQDVDPEDIVPLAPFKALRNDDDNEIATASFVQHYTGENRFVAAIILIVQFVMKFVMRCFLIPI